MPRLFVGLELPQEIRNQLLLLQGGVKGARWQSDSQLHLTLRFIGDVDGGTARDALEALSSVRFQPFQAALTSVGNFGKNGFIRTLWAGATPEAAFEALHKKIDRALISSGLESEGRRYKPHVTLARISQKPRPGEMESFIHRNGLFRTPEFEVNTVSLFLSELGHTGAHYTVLERFEAAA